MDMYLNLLKRAFPGVNLRISEHQDWDEKSKLTIQSITILIANKKTRTFHTFQQFVDYVNYLIKDELDVLV